MHSKSVLIMVLFVDVFGLLVLGLTDSSESSVTGFSGATDGDRHGAVTEMLGCIVGFPLD